MMAHLLEAFEYIESYIKRRKVQQRINPVGFKKEEKWIIPSWKYIHSSLRNVLAVAKNTKKLRGMLKKKSAKIKTE